MFLVFPGIIFDIGPTQLLSLKEYIIWCNVSKSISGVLGRLFALNKCIRKYHRLFLALMIPVSLFVAFFYFEDLRYSFEIISASMIILIGVLLATQGIICSSAAVIAGEKVSDEERERVGALVTYCTIIGTVLGNMASFGLKYFK